MNPYDKHSDCLLELDWKNDAPFSVDFILTKRPTKFRVPKRFIESQQFVLEDAECGFYLTLHFYKSTNRDGNYIILLPRPLHVVLRDRAYEIMHNLKTTFNRC